MDVSPGDPEIPGPSNIPRLEISRAFEDAYRPMLQAGLLYGSQPGGRPRQMKVPILVSHCEEAFDTNHMRHEVGHLLLGLFYVSKAVNAHSMVSNLIKNSF